ncbi:hypothetical protein [Rubrivirga sp.]|uniref:hypothetical protein n=1 Tax=Rubrivirga sp. TaxID=1885344 RepID=UPI003B51F720
MFSVLSPRAHGVLDYVTVAIFALAPTVLGLVGLAATLSYVLAAVHLLTTLLTAFPLGVVRRVSFPLHGTVELAVGAALVLAGSFLFEGTARMFYLVMGVVILLVYLLTHYRGAPATV